MATATFLPPLLAAAAKLAEDASSGSTRRLVSTGKVAERLCVSRITIKNWYARGEFPGPVLKTRRLWLWDLDEIEKFLAEARERNATPRPTGDNGHAA